MPHANVADPRRAFYLAVCICVSLAVWAPLVCAAPPHLPDAAQSRQDWGEEDPLDTEPADTRPIPLLIPIPYPDGLRPPPPLPSPTMPKALIGKILFVSYVRYAAGEVFALDPQTRALWVVTDTRLYRLARNRDAFSANKQYQAFVKTGQTNFDFEWYDGEIYSFSIDQEQIHYFDQAFSVSRGMSLFGSGDSWDPVWSPAGDIVAFVSNETGNDEIYTVIKDQWPPRQLTRNSWEWDKHPSWSPDGKQIAFMSNRTGRLRIWLMNADGSNQRPLTDDFFDAYNPVWVKYEQ